MLEAIGLRKFFGDRVAVADVSLQVRAGELLGLLGPNGAGKSTTVGMLCGLIAPDAGHVTIAGASIAANAAAFKRRIGLVPQDLALFEDLGARANVELFGALYGLHGATLKRRALEVLSIVGLAERAGDRPATFSGGMKRRLNIACALVHDPEVLLLDEPASGLDPGARVALRDLVRRLAGEGKTVLVSSHVLAELEEMADTAVYVADGVTAAADAVAAAGRSARQWRVRALHAERLREALIAAGFGTVAHIDHLGAIVPLASEADAAQLLAHLVSVGVPVSSFAPAVGDLEHVFLDLNRAGPPPAASAPDPAAPIDGGARA